MISSRVQPKKVTASRHSLDLPRNLTSGRVDLTPRLVESVLSALVSLL